MFINAEPSFPKDCRVAPEISPVAPNAETVAVRGETDTFSYTPSRPMRAPCGVVTGLTETNLVLEGSSDGATFSSKSFPASAAFSTNGRSSSKFFKGSPFTSSKSVPSAKPAFAAGLSATGFTFDDHSF